MNADIQFDDGAVLHGYNLFAYCADNPTNHLDYFGKSTTSVLDLWLKTGWVFAGADGPLPIGEGVYVIGIALLLLVSEFDPKPENFSNNITYLPNSHAIAPSFQAPNEPPTQPISVDDVIFKNNNPDPFARPGQKKQGRENKEKKKKSDNWKGNPNKRIKKQKKHTPGRDHRKY